MGILSLHALFFSKDFIMNPFLDFQKRSTCQPQTIEPNSLSFTGTLTWWKATGLTEQQLCSLIPLVNPCFVWHLKQGLRAGTAASSFVVQNSPPSSDIPCQSRCEAPSSYKPVFQAINPFTCKMWLYSGSRIWEKSMPEMRVAYLPRI